MAYFYSNFYLYKEILINLTINRDYYNHFKQFVVLTQKYIDINYEIESTVKFNGLKMSLITFCKRDPQMTFVPNLPIY